MLGTPGLGEREAKGVALLLGRFGGGCWRDLGVWGLLHVLGEREDEGRRDLGAWWGVLHVLGEREDEGRRDASRTLAANPTMSCQVSWPLVGIPGDSPLLPARGGPPSSPLPGQADHGARAGCSRR